MTPNNLWIDCPYHMWSYKEEINGKCLFKVYFNSGSFVKIFKN